jgi:hypothetical protein
MKTIVVTPLIHVKVKAWKMSIGDIGVIAPDQGSQLCEHVGHTVLRTYCGIFSLTNPNVTWSFYSEEESPFFDIDLLPAGSTVTLLVEPPDTVKEEDEELNEEY